MGIVVGGLLGVVAVGGVELHTTFTTPREGFIQQLALTTGPKDDTVTVGDDHLQSVDGEGTLLTYLGITVFDDCSVEVDCDYHET